MWRQVRVILPAALLFLIHTTGLAQCLNSVPWASATAPTALDSPTTISTCTFAGDYSTITNAVAGSSYRMTSSVGTDFITIRQGVPGGEVLVFGATPVEFTVTADGPIYGHVNLNAECGTQDFVPGNYHHANHAECDPGAYPIPVMGGIGVLWLAGGLGLLGFVGLRRRR
jgi:hypothetical protein